VARERYGAATLHNSVRRCWFVRRHPATLPLPIGVFVEVGTSSILRVAIATTSPLLSSSPSLLAQTELVTGGVVDSWSSRRRARSRLPQPRLTPTYRAFTSLAFGRVVGA
jgi:hypothetical protein